MLSADQEIRYLYIYTIYTIHYLLSIYYIYFIIISRQNRYNIVIPRVWPADQLADNLPTICRQTAFLFYVLLLPQGLEGFYALVGKLSTGTLELSTGFLSCPIRMDEILFFIFFIISIDFLLYICYTILSCYSISGYLNHNILSFCCMLLPILTCNIFRGSCFTLGLTLPPILILKELIFFERKKDTC